MSVQSLSSRLQALTETYKQTLDLIQRLQRLPADPGTFPAQEDLRLELSSEIHQNLKEQEDALDILRQETDEYRASTGASGGRWVGGGAVPRRTNSETNQDHERTAATIARLEEDLKTARALFRRAQLQAKRNADAVKRKEREALFAKRSTDPENLIPTRRKGQEKLTQDELALNASSDISASLRRTLNLMQDNIQQSQFAQQTLDESQSALASLGQSYTDLGGLLKSSRGLAGQLLRSQKSDTWYLETAFYMLVATIAWLTWRRILYGPAWWLVWQPLKLTWWILMTLLTGIGVTGRGQDNSTALTRPGFQSVSMSGVNSRGFPTFPAGRDAPYMVIGGKGGGWDRPLEPPPLSRTIAEEVGAMAQRTLDETRSGQAHAERNTKKRMMEVEPSKVPRDEL